MDEPQSQRFIRLTPPEHNPTIVDRLWWTITHSPRTHTISIGEKARPAGASKLLWGKEDGIVSNLPTSATGFTAPAGKKVAGLKVDGLLVTETTVTVNGNITRTSTWEES